MLPESIRSLRNLLLLSANDNWLTTVPRWLEEMPLLFLSLNRNPLEEFPFLHLPELMALCLSGTGLSKLPCVVRDYPLQM